MRKFFKSIFKRKPKHTKGHDEHAIYGRGWCIIDGEFMEE